jgi:hypothetical protein
MSTASLYSPVTRRQDLEAQNAELRARLDELLAAVEEHLDDPRDDADARLYRRVFGIPERLARAVGRPGLSARAAGAAD